MRHSPCTDSSTKYWRAAPPWAVYCPLASSVASSCQLTMTLARFPWPEYRPVCWYTLGVLARIVTCAPGRHSLLAPGVRYSRAVAWLCAKLALASRKPLTTCSGPQPGWGPSTISPPPDTPPPAGGAGIGADPTGPDEGMVAQPVASSVARIAPSSSVNRMRAGLVPAPGRPSAIAATFRQVPATRGPVLATGGAPIADGRVPVTGGALAAGRASVAGGAPGSRVPVAGRASVTTGQGGGRADLAAGHAGQAEPGNGDAGRADEVLRDGRHLRLIGTERQWRARQFLAERARQGQPEHRSLPALSPGLQPPPVKPGILERDGQPEAGAAGGARAGRVGTPEPVEDQVLFARPETHAVVTHRDRHRVPVRGHRDHHVAALAMLDRVVEQVAQDPLHPAPVHLGDAGLGWQPEVEVGALAGRQLFRVGRRPADQVADIGRLGVQGRHVGVVAADLQQVREQLLEPLQLALQ